MTKYSYAERVVKKVRNLLKHDERVSNFIQNHPSIELDTNFCIQSLVWTYYELKLIVTSTYMVYINRDTKMVLCHYNGFDDLLSIK